MTRKSKLKTISLERSIETKELQPNIIADKKLNDILCNFEENIDRINKKFIIINELESKKLEEAAKDILRSQIVLLMSSVDFYIHEIVKYGIIKIFKGEKNKTKEYKAFIVSIECVEKAIKNPESIDWLEENIIVQNKYKSFMALNKINNALKIISDKNILDNSIKKVASDLGKEISEIRYVMKIMNERRNCIAHQTDRDPIKCNINDISIEEVKNGIYIVSKLILDIHDKVKNDV
ncbi:MAG: hypothetical protein E7D79_15490 [Clostridium perfringens]|uniref:RiboL-PSP-HEPN domain-containing protein n=1 Tax=Clostridium perfringens TaxID=1502 RepID=A0AAW4J0F9_CLOPF|nr:hypothetical protein [Clostridium perfringens]EHP46925.1 hypothetical protein HMPREF9476_02275 [Clostridium perfringens WAL-14572]MBO3357077.1 hypothetical protein [Clostridium perfringens]MBO3360348.1 hypothetical protein [Clostridium perfringens]MCX0417602.1 hypothetical protein [Clostridium perfringens]MDM0713602.1 hypothetical protein [Clostridium perfringens]